MSKSLLLLLFLAWSNMAVSAGYFPMYSTWDQPAGLGSPITLSYSYINLLDGGIKDMHTGMAIDNSLLKNIVEIALQDYANILPIHFVEQIDSGPLPETGEYNPLGHPDIRMGHVPHIDGANAYAYFPFEDSGLAGDIIFNADRFGFQWLPSLFYAIVQHELGHSLGMGHFVEESEVAHLASADSSYTGPIYPLTIDMITALQGAYGAGVGSVTPLSAVPLPAAFWLFSSAFSMLFGFRLFSFNKQVK